MNSRYAMMIVIGGWVLMTIILANSYASTFLSFLSVKKMGPVINSLDELAHSKGTQLVAQAGMDLTNRFLVGPFNIFKF